MRKKTMSKKELLELLGKGAQIEVTAWGMNPMIDVRLKSEDLFERVTFRAFDSLRTRLIQVGPVETLTTTYKLKNSALSR